MAAPAFSLPHMPDCFTEMDFSDRYQRVPTLTQRRMSAAAKQHRSALGPAPQQPESAVKVVHERARMPSFQLPTAPPPEAAISTLRRRDADLSVVAAAAYCAPAPR